MKKLMPLLALTSLLVACGHAADPGKAVADAQALIAQGKAGEARIRLKNALAKTGNIPGARQLLAMIALSQGDAQAASDELAALDAATAATPQVAGLKARVALALGNADEALRQLDAAGTTVPEPERTLLRAAALRAKGALADALILLRGIQQNRPDDSKLVVEIAGTLAAMGNLTAAVAELDGYLAVADHPRTDALRARGDLKLRQGLPTKAVEDLKAALESAPRDWPPSERAVTELMVGEALLSAGEIDKARIQIDRIAKNWPGMSGTEILSARLALLDGHARDAVDRLNALATAAPDNARLQYLLVDALVQSGNLAGATALLERRVAAEPPTSPARRMLANLWMRQGRPDKVIELLGDDSDEQLAAGATDDLLASARLARTSAGEAITALTRRLAAQPQDQRLRAALAAAQVANGEPAAALTTLGDMPEHDWAPEAAAVRMTALLNMGNEIEANRLVDRLLDPAAGAGAAALVAAADAAQRQRRGAIVSRLLDRAVAVDANNADVQLRRASLAFDARRYDEAERILRDVLQAQPEFLTASVALARVAEAKGNVDAAREALRDAIRRSPKSPEPALTLASLELRANRPAESSKVLDALIAAQPDGTAANAAGLLLARTNRLDEARARFGQAVEQDSHNAVYWFNMGRAQLALTDRAAARESFVKSAQLQPGSLPAAAAAVRLSLEQRDAATAVKLATSLVTALPNSAGAMLLQGEAALAAGQSELARKAFERATVLKSSGAAALGEYRARLALRTQRPDAPLLNWLAHQPDDLATRRILGDYYLDSGNDAAAREQFEQVIRHAPSDVASLNNLAWVLRKSDTARAERLALQARAIAPDSPSIADTLGMIYLAGGKYDQAVELLAGAATKLAQDRSVQYHHALALHRAGRDADAREALRKALQGDADFRDRAEARQLQKELGT